MNLEGIDWDKQLGKFEILFTNDEAEKVVILYLTKMEALSFKESLEDALDGFKGYEKINIEDLEKAIKIKCRNL